MASNGAPDSFAPETILAAMATMRGGEPDKKKAAMDYLGKFQKSVSKIPASSSSLSRQTDCKLMRMIARCMDDDPHYSTIDGRGRSRAFRSDDVEGKGTLRVAPMNLPHHSPELD